MSPTPCWRRVREMEEAGVIRGYVALVDRHRWAWAPACGCASSSSSTAPTCSIASSAWSKRLRAGGGVLRALGETDCLLKLYLPNLEACRCSCTNSCSRSPRSTSPIPRWPCARSERDRPAAVRRAGRSRCRRCRLRAALAERRIATRVAPTGEAGSRLASLLRAGAESRLASLLRAGPDAPRFCRSDARSRSVRRFLQVAPEHEQHAHRRDVARDSRVHRQMCRQGPVPPSRPAGPASRRREHDCTRPASGSMNLLVA